MLRARYFLLVAVLTLGHSQAALSQSEKLVAPPRDITDITAVLDATKPDLAAFAALKAKADAAPAAGAGGKFFYGRAQARAELGRNAEAIADAQKAVTFGGDYANEVSRYEQFLGRQYRAIGDHKRALEIASRTARNFENDPHNKGRLFPTYLSIVIGQLTLGNPDQAAATLARSRALLPEARAWTWSMYGTSWQANVEQCQALLFEARGQYRDAERAYVRTTALMKDAMVKALQWPSSQPRADWYRDINFLIADGGRMKARQGRLSEAENDIRLALRDQLRAVGKYNASTAALIRYLASVMIDQGRLADAETLARAALEIVTRIGLPPDASPQVAAVALLANIVELRQRHTEAAELFADLDVRIQDWEPGRRQVYQLNRSRIFTLYALNKVAEGIDLAKSAAANSAKSYGPNHFNTAYARGVLAIGLARSGNDKEALAEFRFAVPLLTTGARETSDDDTATVANRDAQMQRILEPYIALMARAGGAGGDVAAETFALGEAMRSRAVQRAITAAAARMAQPNDALSKLVRNEQDLDKQIKANLVLLSRLLAQPQEGRDEKGVQAQNALIDKLRAEHRQARQEIEKRQPRYTDLVDPKPPSAKTVAEQLRPGEALLSFFFGRQSSFVWVVRQGSPAVLAVLPTTIADIETRVGRVRESLDSPDGEPIPEFDLAGAAELYELLLKPIEPHWQGSQSLLLITNGALATLPLGVLPTARVEVTTGGQPLFAEYRKVPWLARTHAVSLVPSAAALLTLRGVAQGAADREMLIGFGDPQFSKTPAPDDKTTIVASSQSIDTRGVAHRRALPSTRGLNNADLSSLAPLPDTALELKAIAQALHADAAKALHLGVHANEKEVKTANLARYKVVAFATHGLLPNDLDGLTEPALALTAPEIAGVEGDGLLTMEEILSLKLDADWVLLSACNTAAGTSSGAEVASGLGRAFFYAGARALLVTNWAVDSGSARDLVTGLFDRYASTPGVNRSEALRQTMMHMLDQGAWADASGRVLYSYAHPMFWAPYSVVGGGT